MKLIALLERTRNYPIFSLEDCRKWFPENARATLILELSQYASRGHLVRLKRGLYLRNSEPFPHPFAIASRLAPDTVISLESVLHRAGITPEVPFAITAVSPGKTARVSSRAGMFLFRHLKPQLLFGWDAEQYSPYAVRVAHPEKAMLDLLWFHRFERNPDAYLRELRLTIPRAFSWKRLREYGRAFADPSHATMVARLQAQYQ